MELDLGRRSPMSGYSGPTYAENRSSSWTWNPRRMSFSQPGHLEAQGRAGGHNDRTSTAGLSLPDSFSHNDLVYPAPGKQVTHHPAAMAAMDAGPSRQQHERKPWLKPVASLLRGIPRSKQEPVWSGGSSLPGPLAPTHMVRQQGNPPHLAAWRGSASARTAVVDSSTVSTTEYLPFERQKQQQQQQQQHATSCGSNHATRSHSPRIVRGPEMFPPLESDAFPPSQPQQQPNRLQLYDLPSQSTHHRSGSLRDRPEIRVLAHSEVSSGRHTGNGFEYFEQQPQQSYISTAAADAAVAAVPVPGDETDPYRTPTAARASTRFWGEPGESPMKQQRNNSSVGITKNTRSKALQQPSMQAAHGERYTEHRMSGMSDTTTVVITPCGTKRNRCLMPGCSKPPRYALPGQKAEYCTLHKMDNYVDVKHPRCESELGCVRQPTFGWEGEKARFCSAHKIENMLDVKNPRCGEPGCLKRPRYGEEGGRARFCAAHRFDDMVDLASRRSTGGANSGSKPYSSSPAKRPRNGPRSFAHDSADAAAAVGASPSVSMPDFGHRVGGGGGGRAPPPKRGHPVPKRGHTPARAGGHRRATSESWIDFCPKRVFESTTAKDAADIGADDVPRHASATARRAEHQHAPCTVNTNMGTMAAAAAVGPSPTNSLSIMGKGDKAGFGGSGKGGVTSTVFFHGGSIGASRSWSSGNAAPGWLPGGTGSGTGGGDTAAAAAPATGSSVSIAALGGEITVLAAAPVSDASPLPSPGSASSLLETGGASTSASGNGFPASFSGGGGGGATVSGKKKLLAPMATVTAPVSPQGSSESIVTGTGGGRKGAKGGKGGHRFDASDYEASAILLECRSGTLSGEKRI